MRWIELIEIAIENSTTSTRAMMQSSKWQQLTRKENVLKDLEYRFYTKPSAEW